MKPLSHSKLHPKSHPLSTTQKEDMTSIIWGANNKTQALKALDKVKKLLIQTDYKHAKRCIKLAIHLYPDIENALEMSIVSETLYYGNMHLECGIDWYSLLHLHPSVTETVIKSQVQNLLKHVTSLTTKGFPGIQLTLDFINESVCILCDNAKRHEFDLKRYQSGLLDPPPESRKGVFREDYLQWKSPILSNGLKWVDDEEGEPILSMEEKKLIDHQVFDTMLQNPRYHLTFEEMPQNPHYRPLDKYCSEVREAIMLGLNIVFVDLAEEIRQLKHPQSFRPRLDAFTEQLTQLEEFGYDVEKLRGRLDSLKKIAEHERELNEELEKLEIGVKDSVVKIEKCKTRILEFEAEIEKCKALVEGRDCQISALMKDSMEAVKMFVTTAKGAWK